MSSEDSKLITMWRLKNIQQKAIFIEIFDELPG